MFFLFTIFQKKIIIHTCISLKFSVVVKSLQPQCLSYNQASSVTSGRHRKKTKTSIFQFFYFKFLCHFLIETLKLIQNMKFVLKPIHVFSRFKLQSPEARVCYNVPRRSVLSILVSTNVFP